jgi:opacity protein-like surface antigen
MNTKKILFFLLLVIAGFRSESQDSLLRSLNDSLSVNQNTRYVSGTFKALYVVNLKTIEAPAAGALNVEIQHRFGSLNSGGYNLFGLDNATLRLGLDYGITDRLAVGIGRSSFYKTYDAYLKFKLLRQTDHSMRMPVSVSLLGSVSYYADTSLGKKNISNSSRLSYTTQIMIARKFNSHFSLEIVPTFIHYNMVPVTGDKNNVFALAGGARMKISNRMALTAEYDYLFPNQLTSPTVNHSLSFGWDIETGGHVFQLVFSNSQFLTESQFIGQMPISINKGDVYFGFNISRNFNLKPHNKKTGS